AREMLRQAVYQLQKFLAFASAPREICTYRQQESFNKLRDSALAALIWIRDRHTYPDCISFGEACVLGADGYAVDDEAIRDQILRACYFSDQAVQWLKEGNMPSSNAPRDIAALCA